jgi:hypothetical protein
MRIAIGMGDRLFMAAVVTFGVVLPLVLIVAILAGVW